MPGATRTDFSVAQPGSFMPGADSEICEFGSFPQFSWATSFPVQHVLTYLLTIQFVNARDTAQTSQHSVTCEFGLFSQFSWPTNFSAQHVLTYLLAIQFVSAGDTAQISQASVHAFGSYRDKLEGGGEDDGDDSGNDDFLYDSSERE